MDDTYQTMRSGSSILAGLIAVLVTSASAVAGTPANPRLQEVFRSLQNSTRGEAANINVLPIALGIAGLVLMGIAIKHWNRRAAKPTALHSHAKLIREASRAAGVSRRQLKQLTTLAQAAGMSSPLVAVICPSAMKRLAHGVRTTEQKEALTAMAKQMVANR